MRKLASIRQIADIQPIEGADAIDVATVDGWKVVVKKGDYKIGDLAVYFEIDSWVPYELAPFLVKNAAIPRKYNGVEGERLRTIRLRGQISQGLLLPIQSGGSLHATEWTCAGKSLAIDAIDGDFNPEGLDVTEVLGVQKWEAPIPTQMEGQAKGTFPTSFIPKTDQERIQNCFNKVLHGDYTYEVTMKLDGSSMTLFRWEGELRVCSRNMELKINEENKDVPFIKIAMKYGDQVPEGFALQGEIWGESIQGNKEGIRGQRFSIFDVFDIQKHEYLSPVNRRDMCNKLGIELVPVIGTDWKAPSSIEEALSLASGPSINAKNREGIVYKCNEDPSFSFKVISNEWLLKHSE